MGNNLKQSQNICYASHKSTPHSDQQFSRSFFRDKKVKILRIENSYNICKITVVNALISFFSKSIKIFFEDYFRHNHFSLPRNQGLHTLPIFMYIVNTMVLYYNNYDYFQQQHPLVVGEVRGLKPGLYHVITKDVKNGSYFYYFRCINSQSRGNAWPDTGTTYFHDSKDFLDKGRAIKELVV